MRMTDLEREMRARECYHELTVLAGAWPILRLDGRSFSRLTEVGFDKPFDANFSQHMVKATEELVTQLHGIYGYTESDEISILLPATSALFNRSVEKLVSISAGIASSVFSQAIGMPAHFDSRLWVGASREDVIDYFSWRQADAARCGLNGWVYWTLRREGASAAQATARLLAMKTAAKNELLFEHNINYNDVPAWQRRGIGITWESYGRPGWNPVTGQPVTARRRRLTRNAELPMKAAYRVWLSELITTGSSPPSGPPSATFTP